MSEITRFYRQASPTSDLGRHRDLLPGLPADPEALGAIVRGLLVHNFTAKVRGLRFPAERMAHMQTVGAEAILDNVFSLDPAPLALERPAERRMVGFCYHFALPHCALLRATGTPARIRCGFAGYFEARRWIDHWVVEYWDGDGWRLTDPQIGRADLTGDDFQNGLSAWNQCRGGGALPALYGNGELWGWDELRGSLINDVAALNKVEVAGWYWCERLKVEPLDQPHDELDTSLDVLSRRAATADSVETIKEFTGASQGIGAAVAGAYRKRGYSLVAVARSMPASDDPDVLTVSGDLSRPGTGARVVAQAMDRFGRVDTLVNNAGIYIEKPFTDYTDADYDLVTGVNLRGFFDVTRSAIPAMLAGGVGGHVLCVSTSLVDRANARIPAALASLTKGGLVAVTKELAIEYASRAIRANAFSLGVIRTPMNSDDPGGAFAALHPLGRMGEIDDVVEAIMYLEQAPFVTGEILHVDGGQSAGL